MKVAIDINSSRGRRLESWLTLMSLTFINKPQTFKIDALTKKNHDPDSAILFNKLLKSEKLDLWSIYFRLNWHRNKVLYDPIKTRKLPIILKCNTKYFHSLTDYAYLESRQRSDYVIMLCYTLFSLDWYTYIVKFNF